VLNQETGTQFHPSICVTIMKIVQQVRSIWDIRSSGMLRGLNSLLFTDVSEETIPSIF
jgi:hypothetical protein